MVLAGHVAQQDIGRLHVAVDQARGLMHGFQRPGELGADRDRPLRRQAPSSIEQLPKVDPVDPLHHQVEAAVLVADVVDGDDVRVVHRGGQLRLAKEALAVFGLRGDLLADHLQRHVAFERLLARLVDDTHAACPRDVADLEIAQSISDLQFLCHCWKPHSACDETTKSVPKMCQLK